MGSGWALEESESGDKARRGGGEPWSPQAMEKMGHGYSETVFFLNIFIDYAITVAPFPPHSTPSCPPPSLPHSPPIVHVHGSYL